MTADAKKQNLGRAVSAEQQNLRWNTGKTKKQRGNYRLEICPQASILLFVYGLCCFYVEIRERQYSPMQRLSQP
jgi:hypothetical protein